MCVGVSVCVYKCDMSLCVYDICVHVCDVSVCVCSFLYYELFLPQIKIYFSFKVVWVEKAKSKLFGRCSQWAKMWVRMNINHFILTKNHHLGICQAQDCRGWLHPLHHLYIYHHPRGFTFKQIMSRYGSAGPRTIAHDNTCHLVD